jgi:hypothetical protein
VEGEWSFNKAANALWTGESLSKAADALSESEMVFRRMRFLWNDEFSLK